jgi:hypothetical protein
MISSGSWPTSLLALGRSGIGGEHVQRIVHQRRDLHPTHRSQRNPFALERVQLGRNYCNIRATVTAITHKRQASHFRPSAGVVQQGFGSRSVAVLSTIVADYGHCPMSIGQLNTGYRFAQATSEWPADGVPEPWPFRWIGTSASTTPVSCAVAKRTPIP